MPAPKPVVRRLLVAGVVGLPLARAVRTLRAIGAEPNVYPVPSSAPRGTVVAQHPRPGTRARAGDPVRVNVSAGRR